MTILAAIGEEDGSDEIIQTAADLADAYEEPLSVVHVIPDSAFVAHKEAIESTPVGEGLSFSQEKDSAAEYARRMTEESLEEIDYERVTARGRVGDPATEVLAVIDNADPRFLIIGTRGRSPVGKAVFGSTTQKLLLNATCPVVTVPVETP